MNKIKVGVKKLHENAILPTYAHLGDAGADIYTLEDTIIKANETVVIKSGIALELPSDMECQVRPRSGVSLSGCKGCLEFIRHTRGIPEDNIIMVGDRYARNDSSPYLQVQFGTCDSNYKGDIGIITWNREQYDVLVPKWTRLAQIVIKKTENIELVEVDELSESDRGSNGYGSTGIK